ncbi:MAG: signal peptidase II [Elusimicrobiota bacterium]
MIRPVYLAAPAVLALDQLSKLIVLRTLPLNETVPVLPFFSLTPVVNTGAAFGIFGGNNSWLILSTTVILAILSVYYWRAGEQDARARAGLALLWGGALGNLMDRVLRGGVVDFLDFHWRGWHWPAFNVADSCICAGVALLALAGFRRPAGDGPAAGNENV